MIAEGCTRPNLPPCEEPAERRPGVGSGLVYRSALRIAPTEEAVDTQ